MAVYVGGRIITEATPNSPELTEGTWNAEYCITDYMVYLYHVISRINSLRMVYVANASAILFSVY